MVRGGGGWDTVGGRQCGEAGPGRGGPSYAGLGSGAGTGRSAPNRSGPESGRCQYASSSDPVGALTFIDATSIGCRQRARRGLPSYRGHPSRARPRRRRRAHRRLRVRGNTAAAGADPRRHRTGLGLQRRRELERRPPAGGPPTPLGVSDSPGRRDSCGRVVWQPRGLDLRCPERRRLGPCAWGARVVREPRLMRGDPWSGLSRTRGPPGR